MRQGMWGIRFGLQCMLIGRWRDSMEAKKNHIFPGKHFVHNLYAICIFMLPGTWIDTLARTHTHGLWSYILFAESALAAACKNRLTGVRIFKQLLYKKLLTVDALFDCSRAFVLPHIIRPAAENEHDWRTAMCERDMILLIAKLTETCFSERVCVFGVCGDSYLVDMETKIAAKWKRTVSLPLRLCSMLKKMERERQNEGSERMRKDRRGERRKL